MFRRAVSAGIADRLTKAAGIRNPAFNASGNRFFDGPSTRCAPVRNKIPFRTLILTLPEWFR
jgi:hypothetical protein